MNMLVLGAGLQGSACAYDLLHNGSTGDDAPRILLADRETGPLPPFLRNYEDDARLERVSLDATDHDAVRATLERAAVCMNALPYYFNLDIAGLAADAGVHYCDLGGNTEIVFDQLELDAAAKRTGVSLIPDCGLAPGMVNILAAAGIEQCDEAESVRIVVGGLPRNPEPPLDYQVVYSLEGVLDYYTTDSWVLRDGEPAQVEALSGIETAEFPAPVGTLEAFHTAGGLSTMPWTYEGRLRTMEYKTLRYPGHAEKMKAIRDLGLLDAEPVTVPGAHAGVTPRDVFIAAAGPHLERPDSPDLVALRVEVEGTKDGAARRVVYELIDTYDDEAGISAMERTTGFSLSITGQMQADGRITKTGAFTPDRGVPADEYVRELRARGIDIRERTG